ncbi:hypothetical protein BCEN4_610025 [Burkholderia cenocepacia]|nr:hypothetical protein BCEN4_610025 [Burkholderia cenocepacia]
MQSLSATRRNHSSPTATPFPLGQLAIFPRPASLRPLRNIRQHFPYKREQERFSFNEKLHRMPPENKS